MSAIVTKTAIWIVRHATSRYTGVSMILWKFSRVNVWTISAVNGSVSQNAASRSTKSEPK